MSREQELDCYVHIGAITSNVQPDYITLEIVDGASEIQFLEIDMSHEEFARLLMRHGQERLKVKVRGLDRVGKKREHKTEQVLVKKKFFWQSDTKDATKINRENIIKACEKAGLVTDGWVPDSGGCLNRRGGIEDKFDTKGYLANVDFYRWVPTEEEKV